MTKFTGDEKEYAFWKLSFQQSYGARQITEVEKVLYSSKYGRGTSQIMQKVC